MWQEIDQATFESLKKDGGLKPITGGRAFGGGVYCEWGVSNLPTLRRDKRPGKPAKFYRWV